MTECYRCGSDDHLVRDCPLNYQPPATTPPKPSKPPWCGQCDERTRLVTVADGRMARCHACHPLRGQELAQHKICPGCHHRVYAWDQQLCGNHQEPAASAASS